MTIHHDKLAYGKLASNMEELSEDKLNEMLKQLSEEEKAAKEDNGRGGTSVSRTDRLTDK